MMSVFVVTETIVSDFCYATSNEKIIGWVGFHFTKAPGCCCSGYCWNSTSTESELNALKMDKAATSYKISGDSSPSWDVINLPVIFHAAAPLIIVASNTKKLLKTSTVNIEMAEGGGKWERLEL